MANMSARIMFLTAGLIFTSVIAARADLTLEDCADNADKQVKAVFKTEGEIELPCAAS